MATRKEIRKTIFPSLESTDFSNPANIHPLIPDCGRDILVAIQTRLDAKTRFTFTVPVICITSLVVQQKRMAGPRGRLRTLVASNEQIWNLYDEYARVHWEEEDRVTYRLPVYEDLVVDEEDDAEEVSEGEDSGLEYASSGEEEDVQEAASEKEEDQDSASSEEDEDVEDESSSEDEKVDGDSENAENASSIDDIYDAMEDIQ